MALAVDDIVDRCSAALTEHTPALAVRDVLDELVAAPEALDHALGPITFGGITTLHNADDLTILRVAWTPGMALNPHEHRMWAVIGMYGGQRRQRVLSPGGKRARAPGGRELPAGDVLVLGDDVIHSVANSRQRIHGRPPRVRRRLLLGSRSEWDFETFEERPHRLRAHTRLFEAANRALARTSLTRSRPIRSCRSDYYHTSR